MTSITRRFAAALLVALLLGTTAYAQPGDTTPTPTPTPVPVQDPPSGPGLGKQTVPPPVQLSPDELTALKDAEAEYERFLIAATAHDNRMRAIAKREFDAHTTDISKRYADRIAKTEAARSRHKGDTVALLEKFLVNHPAHEQFTPDKMFQLADLYLDAADEEVDARLAALEQSGQPAPEGGIVADYSRSTTLWETILTKFPKYRQTPSTMYLLAYYGKSKDERRSLTIFLALACANRFKWNDASSKPPTREEAIKRVESKTMRDPYNGCTPYPNSDEELIRHAWVRGIADYHFTIPGEIDESIAAYLKVANGGNESRLYAESLYKLAWSYYKR
ncbi:MAG: hypothetical protein H0T65_00170, partial [Deltaproteobacteria bacterium]|nr:hypothetical protein [Deltaproteobacteria bacterium]